MAAIVQCYNIIIISFDNFHLIGNECDLYDNYIVQYYIIQNHVKYVCMHVCSTCN